MEGLCQRLARLIKGWLDEGEELVSEGRPLRPGDILILVRRRDPFTTPMIRALKRARVPVAGADRMRLLQQLAVKDLVALADVMLMPEDDLALAIVLKSPLFGLDDDALFDLAYMRPSSLWATLKAKAKDDPRFREAASTSFRAGCPAPTSRRLTSSSWSCSARTHNGCGSGCSPGSGQRRPRRWMSSSILPLPMTGRRLPPSRASSMSFA